MEITINENVNERYRNQGQDYLLCLIRRKLIVVKPEEIVRQGIVELLCSHGVDLERILVEVPMSYFGKGKNGRADIIVYKDTDHSLVEFVIECKAKSIALTDNVLRQVLQYNAILDCEFVCVTNGYELRIYRKTQEDVEEVTYEDFGGFVNNNLEMNTVESSVWIRTTDTQIESDAFITEYDKRTTGAPSFPKFSYFLDYESSKSIKQVAIRLIDLFFDISDDKMVTQLNTKTCKLILDKGERFGFYSFFGGTRNFTEYYRYFILEDKNGNHFTVNFAVYSYDYFNAETNENFESSHRGVYLMIGYDNREISSHTLEYKLDKHLVFKGDSVEFWHDGAMTVTKRQKNETTINFIRQEQPELLKDGKIFLGSLPVKGQLFAYQSDITNLLSNIIDYIVLREQLKVIIRNERI